VPFVVKDVLPWPGLRWSMGSRVFASNVAQRQTPLGTALVRAGLHRAGKSAMSELGLLSSTETLLAGVTHNPWDLSRLPAGSSGGSAAAVAAGIVPIAHANDGGVDSHARLRPWCARLQAEPRTHFADRLLGVRSVDLDDRRLPQPLLA
jgi:Asp-tRNA(Asn)/Glu-tRNA(Gln) amidotransferase A subunit family amidase